MNYKQQATALSIAETIAFRTSYAVSAVDLSGTNPIISVGAVAATTNVGFQLSINDQRDGNTTDPAWQALPGFGAVAQPVYTGTVVRLAYEAGAAPKAYFVDIWEVLAVAMDIARRGATVEIWEITNGNAPTIANIAALGTLRKVFDGNLYFPLSDRV